MRILAFLLFTMSFTVANNL